MKLVKPIKINIIFFLILYLMSGNSYAALSCSDCKTLNDRLADQVDQCGDDLTAATEDGNTASDACSQSQIVGTLIGSALMNNPSTVRGSDPVGVTTMKLHMTDYGTNLTKTIEERNKAIVTAYGNMTQKLIDTVVDSQLKYAEMVTNIEKNDLKARMEYQSDLISSSSRETGNVVGTGTSEEVEFILYELDKATTEHTPVVIAQMKAKYDSNDNFKIPVRYKHTEGLTAEASVDCPKYDPKDLGELTDYSCYKAQDADPGKTLEVYFKECSLNKSRELAKLQESGSKNTQLKDVKEESKRKMEALVSAQSVVNQKIVDEFVACTEEQIILGSCQLKESYSSSDEYRKILIDDIIDNKIVVNGSTSSLNLLTPEVVGSLDGNINITDEEYQSFLKKAGEVNNTAVSTNTPELISTYKTSSQYIAAKGFANNIIGETIVSNIPPERRNDLNTSTFVSSLQQRKAMLNLAKTSYAESISARVGKKLSEEVFSGDLNHKGDVIKEDINGAGKIDNIRHQIEKNFENVSESGAPQGFVSGAPDLKAKMYETEVQKARLGMESYLTWNRIEMILAAKLVEQVNSMNNREYIRDLKNN
jgi:hypothetical protein